MTLSEQLAIIDQVKQIIDEELSYCESLKADVQELNEEEANEFCRNYFKGAYPKFGLETKKEKITFHIDFSTEFLIFANSIIDDVFKIMKSEITDSVQDTLQGYIQSLYASVKYQSILSKARDPEVKFYEQRYLLLQRLLKKLQPTVDKTTLEYGDKYLIVVKSTEGSKTRYGCAYNLKAAKTLQQSILQSAGILQTQLEDSMQSKLAKYMQKKYPRYVAEPFQKLDDHILLLKKLIKQIQNFDGYNKLPQPMQQRFYDGFEVHSELIKFQLKVDVFKTGLTAMENYLQAMKKHEKLIEEERNRKFAEELQQQQQLQQEQEHQKREQQELERAEAKAKNARRKQEQEARIAAKRAAKETAMQALRERYAETVVQNQAATAQVPVYICVPQKLNSEQQLYLVDILTGEAAGKYRFEQITNFLTGLGIRFTGEDNGSHIQVKYFSAEHDKDLQATIWRTHSASSKESELPEKAIEWVIKALWKLGILQGDKELVRGNKRNICILEKSLDLDDEAHILYQPQTKSSRPALG